MFVSPGDRAGRGRGSPFSISDAAVMAGLSSARTWCSIDFSDSVGNSRAFANPANPRKGAHITLWTKQGAVGCNAIVWGSKYVGTSFASSGVTLLPPQPVQVANSVTAFSIDYHHGLDVWVVTKLWSSTRASIWRFDDRGPAVTLEYNPAMDLTGAAIGAVINSVRATLGKPSSDGTDRMFEIIIPAGDQFQIMGIGDVSAATSGGFYTSSEGYGYYSANGNKFHSGVNAAYGAGYGFLTIGFRLDASRNFICYRAGISQGTAYTVTAGITYFPMLAHATAANQCFGYLNTGQIPFAFPVAGVSAWG